MKSTPRRKRWYQILYVQVLMAVALGIVIGCLFPGFGKALKPLGDGFVKLVKMIIAPIIFCTVAHGIASMSDLKRLGRVGLRALIYFEFVSSLALVLGLVVVNVLRPGAGFNIDVRTLDPKISQTYAQQAHSLNATDFILNIIPASFFDGLVRGEILQVLLIAVLSGFAIAFMRERGKPALHFIELGSEVFFRVMGMIVKLAPLGALGAMAFTIGSYGLGALGKLVELMFGFYLTSAIFVLVVLGAVAWFCGFSILAFLGYIKEELLLVLGTSSSEAALPGMLAKMRRLGCAESTVGVVIPAGYSFNLDGTNIYMTMAAMFLAQATNVHLDLGQQLSLLLVAMLSSKGATGVTGAGFITLAATLAIVPSVPIQSLALIVGIDRFMSECRALTNLVGNGVATVAISRWEKEITPEQLRANLRHPETLTELAATEPVGTRPEPVA